MVDIVVDVEAALEVCGDVFGSAGEVAHPGAITVVFAVAEVAGFGEAGVDEFPEESAAIVIADDDGEEFCGEAEWIISFGSGAHLHDVLLEACGFGNEALAGFGVEGGDLALWGAMWDMAAVFFGELAEEFEVAASGDGEDDVAGVVAALVVVLHLFGGEGGDAFVGAEDALTEGVSGEVCGHDVVIAGEGGLVFVHADFFEDNIFFHVEVSLSEGGLEEGGEELECRFEVLGEYCGVVHRDFFAGGCVVFGADFVEDAVDVISGEAVIAFEGHMFEEVADAGDFGSFVAGSGADEETGSDAVDGGVGFGDEGEAVGEGAMVEFHLGPVVYVRFELIWG